MTAGDGDTWIDVFQLTDGGKQRLRRASELGRSVGASLPEISCRRRFLPPSGYICAPGNRVSRRRRDSVGTERLVRPAGQDRRR